MSLMRDTELYRVLLGLQTPWFIERVELKLEQSQVDLWLNHDPKHSFQCPDCGEGCPIHDHAPERTWRHLDTMQYRTVIHAQVPRIDCGIHGVRQVRVPWAEQRSRFTALFERFAIDVMRETDLTGARRILGLSWDEVWNLQQRAVRRGLARKNHAAPQQIGVDEKAIAKGHQYMTLVANLDEPRIEWVEIGREAESLAGYFRALPPEELQRIEAVAMDMWPAFLKATRDWLAEADEKIVYDRFHVTRELLEAVDRARKLEHRHLMREGDPTLKGTKYLWLLDRRRFTGTQRRVFAQLRQINLKTSRAWAIKEQLRELWGYAKPWRGQRHWKQWFFWATHSQIAPIIKAARKLRRHVRYILNYFTHPITNALSESLNAQIEKIKRMAFGFRNQENFKTAIYFHCGGLDLYPSTH